MSGGTGLWRKAGVVVLVPALAWAQPAAPKLQPTRDVVVTYLLEGQATSLVPGGIPGPVRLSWDAAGQRIRAETDGRSQVALLDLKARSGQAMDTTMRIVLPLPFKPSDLGPLTLENARLLPKGKDVIAGLPCTLYQVDGGKTPGLVCLTPDGVALRGEGEFDGKPGKFKALSVSYGRLAPTLFTVPTGYIALGGPGGAGGAAGGIAGLLGKLGGSGGGSGGIGSLSDLKSLGGSLLGRNK